MAYTSDDLITSVRRQARLMDGSDGLSDSEILEIADEVLRAEIMPEVINVREDYYVTEKDFTVTANQAKYRIPSRAVGATVRDVTFIDDGNTGGVSLPMVSLERRDQYAEGANVYWPHGRAFTVQGDHIVLLPTPTAARGTLRVRYYRRPGRLVTEASAAQITALPGSGVLTCTTPTAWSGTITVDVIQADPNFDTLLASGSGTDNGTNVTLASATDPTDVAVGDWVALENESPIVQLPVELHPTLKAGCVLRVLEALGDLQGAQLAAGLYQKRLQEVPKLIDSRVHGEDKRVVNWSSPLRWRRRW